MTQDNKNYVAAWVDYKIDKIIVLERDQDGALFRKKYNPPYYFFVPDEEGTEVSIFGDKLIRAEFESREEYDTAKRHFPVKFESDIAPLKRVLMDNYYERPAPSVYYAFLDIEVDYAQSIGFAGPLNPYAPINAVTVYQSWTGKFLTYVLPPLVDVGDGKSILWTEIPGNDLAKLNAEITSLVEKKQLREGFIPEIVICTGELELLMFMLEAMEQADIISGWNSEFYDLPYIAERLLLLGGERLLSRIDHLGVRLPRKEMVDRYGSPSPIYKLTGKSHLDYMKLFQKFTFEGRTSYALGNILQEEVGVGKLEYEGTLEQLYHNDFPTFVAYNFRDVDGLVQLDAKFKFIALANQMAHENTVHFDAVLGTVAYVETGITNHAHYVLNMKVHDKVIGSHDKVEGAIVMTPRKGLHDWIAAVDIKSLYPNTIRSMNISPEKIIGQFSGKEDAWRSISNGDDTRLDIVLESGEQHILSGADWKIELAERKWAVSAYGTVFDQSGARGVVADILGFWYNERKRLQGEKKKYAKLAEAEKDPEQKKEYLRLEEHFDLLQLTKKISMNSLYGALLNVAFRFGDERMGASVTATGRQITTHMIESLGLLLTGEFHPLEKRWLPLDVKEGGNGSKYVKTTNIYKNEHTLEAFLKLPRAGVLGVDMAAYVIRSDAIIYGDTDSCYYKTYATNKDEAIVIADGVAGLVNDSFPKFMRDAFNCQPGFDCFIEAGREIVGVRGLFQAKKKYVIKVVDVEGKAVNKMKSMGSEIKKADTPKVIQHFLKGTVDMILEGESYDKVATFVNKQRKEIMKNKVNVFNIGVAKQVNNLDKYNAEYLNPGTHTAPDKNGKMRNLTIPGHARASCNYNVLLDSLEKGAKTIRSGDKVLIFYLKPNEYKFDALAFPAESSRFPAWFKEHFSVDIKKTEDKMFDNKLSGIFEAWDEQDVPSPQSVLNQSILEF